MTEKSYEETIRELNPLDYKKLNDLDVPDWNDGYYLEGMDRCHTIMTMMDQLLREHPSIKRVGLDDKFDSAFDLIYEMYQAIGIYEDEELTKLKTNEEKE